MTNFEKLIEETKKFCKDYEYGGTLNVNINEHKTCYSTIREHLIETIFSGDPSNVRREVDEDEMRIIEECEKSGNIYEISLYNLTPIGRWSVFDSSLEGAALQMLEIIDRDKRDKERDKKHEYFVKIQKEEVL